MNKFDYSLILIFILLLFGNYGGGFQPIRIFAIAFFIINIFYIVRTFSFKKNTYLLFSAIFLFFYSLASVFFIMNNFSNSLISCAYFLINLIILANFVTCFEYAKKPLLSSVIGAAVFFIISIFYGIYEIKTGRHLSVNIEMYDGLYSREYSSFTFGNYNGFVLALLNIAPLLAYAIVNYRHWFIKVSPLLLLFGMAYICLTNGSRSGLVGISIIFLYIIYSMKGWFYKAAFILGGVFSASYFLSDFDFFFKRVDTLGVNFSDDSRSSIIFDTLPYYLDNSIKGFGIGNFSYIADNFLALDASAAHNLFFELLFELGPLCLAVFILILVKIILSVRSNTKNLNHFLIFLLILLLPISIVNSGYLLAPIIWVYIALMYSIAVNRRELV
ncbi:O-antigen ligase family protein [Acinetobacter calcoaceticus]|uniref:O-antigen ligase family protein n=1 Tax=Acinetobacter calcoaceticus TaxID=471 RepID=UPI003F7C932C